MLPAVTCLYFLENPTSYVIEIKRTDLPKDAPIKERAKWMMIDKKSLTITSLDFLSLDSAGEIEERWFEQGYLKFNLTEGTYIEKYNSAQHKLERKMAYKLSAAVKKAIADFLSMPVK